MSVSSKPMPPEYHCFVDIRSVRTSSHLFLLGASPIPPNRKLPSIRRTCRRRPCRAPHVHHGTGSAGLGRAARRGRSVAGFRGGGARGWELGSQMSPVIQQHPVGKYVVNHPNLVVLLVFVRICIPFNVDTRLITPLQGHGRHWRPDLSKKCDNLMMDDEVMAWT